MAEWCQAEGVEIWAYCFMPNHVHLIAVPETAKPWRPEEGTPQGAVISPLLANIHLDPLDHMMAREGFEMVRYADDFVTLCRTAQEARRALRIRRRWAASAGLTLHPDKTSIVDATQRGAAVDAGVGDGVSGPGQGGAAHCTLSGLRRPGRTGDGTYPDGNTPARRQSRPSGAAAGGTARVMVAGARSRALAPCP
jgi:hypothetical protein